MIQFNPDIIKRCKKGDERAFAEVYRLHYAFLLGTTKRYIFDHEEAVFQMNTGFATAMCKIEKYNNSAPFSAWLRRVVINSVIDFIRKQKRYKEHLKEYEENVISKENNHVDRNLGEETLQYDDLLKLLECLPNVTKEVFNLFVIDGYKHVEISELLSISTGTSKWHVSRARKLLIDTISQKGELKIIYQAPSRIKNRVL